jgi:hypothetical protein
MSSHLPDTLNKEMSVGEGQRKIYYPLREGRDKVHQSSFKAQNEL